MTPKPMLSRVIAEREPRVKVHIWVQAQVRLCDMHFIPVVIARRGDADAGAVVIRLLRGVQKSVLVRRGTQPDGSEGWITVAGGGEIDDAAADAYVTREVKRDADVWVIEVDDPKGRYWPDAPIRP